MDENMRRLYSFNNRRDPVPDKAPEKPQESLPPKEGERALTVEQIMEVVEKWVFYEVVGSVKPDVFDNLRSSLIDKLGDGQ